MTHFRIGSPPSLAEPERLVLRAEALAGLLEEVADRVHALIADSGKALRAVMLDRLGPVVWSGSPDQAMAALEELEETARLWLTCQPKPSPLSEDQLQELQRSFGAIW